MRCTREGIPYDGKRVWAAVQQVDKNRSGILVEEQRQALDEEARKETRIGKQEAIDIMKYLGIQVGFKSIPRAPCSDVEAYRQQLDAAHALDVEIY
ncbi:MAG: hypothetical protein AUH43_22555 [Acidobacteria bacterium 13_1_40CM_65_14]|nr:MAG: hypothetical protein AUH43_22555 [Acidobacteria bacterium 13_1_40CM_65_14]